MIRLRLHSLAVLLAGLEGRLCVRLPLAGPSDTVKDEAESKASEALSDPSSCDVPAQVSESRHVPHMIQIW